MWPFRRKPENPNALIEDLIRHDCDEQAINRWRRSGIDLNHQNKGGTTALIQAVVSGRQKALEVLLEQGAKLDLKNNQGQTALDIASADEHTAAVQAIQTAYKKRYPIRLFFRKFFSFGPFSWWQARSTKARASMEILPGENNTTPKRDGKASLSSQTMGDIARELSCESTDGDDVLARQFPRDNPLSSRFQNSKHQNTIHARSSQGSKLGDTVTQRSPQSDEAPAKGRADATETDKAQSVMDNEGGGASLGQPASTGSTNTVLSEPKDDRYGRFSTW